MGGFFGVAAKEDCVFDLFFGTDYHSHLGTRRAGMAVYSKEEGYNRAIHNIENAPFRTKFDKDVNEMHGHLGIGCISDFEPQPLMVRFVLGVPMSGSVVGLVGLSLLYLVLALALGLFISTMADSQVTAMLISGMLLILPLIMLSGMVFPIENMPGVLQGISCIVPARWYIEAVRKLMVEGLPFAAVLKEFAVLAVMTGALIGVALGKFNDKLE